MRGLWLGFGPLLHMAVAQMRHTAINCKCQSSSAVLLYPGSVETPAGELKTSLSTAIMIVYIASSVSQENEAFTVPVVFSCMRKEITVRLGTAGYALLLDLRASH